ncbi:MAG: hypothetical protein KGQ37_03690 [Hyphomicrobiales bacterium]|nr:hypothetical protein [Hyphomicrobiales bacterium]
MTTTTIEIPVRHLLAVAMAAGTEETPYNLAGVHVETVAGHVVLVATNGHIMLVDGWPSSGADAQDVNVIIPSSALRRLSLLVGKKIPRSLMVTLKINAGDGATRGSLRLDDASLDFDFIDGTYPDWRKVFPTHRECGHVAKLSPVYLRHLHDAAKLYCGDRLIRNQSVTYGPAFNSPARITWQACDLVGVIMPIAEPRDCLPPWVKTIELMPVSP